MLQPANAESSADLTANAAAPSGELDFTSRLPSAWRVGAIIGGTGSGKTRAIEALRAAGLVDATAPYEWPTDSAIVSAIAASHLVRQAAGKGTLASVWSQQVNAGPPESVCAELAMGRLGCVGLNSLPVWLRPYQALSNGQRARASIAVSLTSRTAVDDFGSTVDAQNASVCAAGIARSVRRKGLHSVVVASVHTELLPWLGADWVLFPATGALHINPNPGAKPAVLVRYDEEVTDAAFVAGLSRPVAPPPLERATRTCAAAAIFGQTGAAPPQRFVSKVRVDAATEAAAVAFEIRFDGTSAEFVVPALPPLPPEWRIGLLVGESGSGKSSLLRTMRPDAGAAFAALGGEGDDSAAWPADAPAASALRGGASAVAAFGGSAIAAAAQSRPFGALSRGERTVVALARLCEEAGGESHEGSGAEPTVADEFTSFVDRSTAAAAAAATRAAWLRRGSGRLVCASVHEDVLPALLPDWSFDLKTRKLTVYSWDPRDLLRPTPAPPPTPSPAQVHPEPASLFAPPAVEVLVRQTMKQPNELEVARKAGDREAVDYKLRLWDRFKAHHYMDSGLNPAATCAVARWGRTPVGFVATMPQPGRFGFDPRLLCREHRLVVLPEFQGLGIGSRLSDATAARFVRRGKRYTSRSGHLTLRVHRERSPLWKAPDWQGEHGRKAADKGMGFEKKGRKVPASAAAGADADAKDRTLFSFEYVGTKEEQAESRAAAAAGLDKTASSPAATSASGTAAALSAGAAIAATPGAAGKRSASAEAPDLPLAKRAAGVASDPVDLEDESQRAAPPARSAKQVGLAAFFSCAGPGSASAPAVPAPSRPRPPLLPRPAASSPAAAPAPKKEPGQRKVYKCSQCHKPKKGCGCERKSKSK
ncbi:hypothetical protein EMIHUDRAFT_106499 [Emiliania huxleyi CCMP1516]|uniref:N-acetyltransferase domain-containing protein n=2 Tax=Emiliania huxleyi TaxID=2903 RepID=A0A0D3I866_EMIH1|nr:hypothetical protein EMIHUDRAFT_106499 [Emiliania huxleyi CCMP1516]EOD07451.1 hypothetical protein EMIHUDRAFT_106499 [Emiliania huxleyi CCMP1516]|eukprot:XP_005759880.1 hypothetical protein EMIHUDRAFT_106499 [Emiliania huxleyi CCMP1516]